MRTKTFVAGDILIPKTGLAQWSVVACDQFTSDPAYWQASAEAAGDMPSALNIIFPEVFLGKVNFDEKIAHINAAMNRYLSEDIFDCYKNSMIYLERTLGNGTLRRGIVGLIDLEQYDYSVDSSSLVRATEGTVLDRIPPRVRIRQNASLESPHVMVLLDDPDKEIIEPLSARKDSLRKVYDFDLMLGGGHSTGYLLEGEDCRSITQALAGRTLAVGDGNHSLATAKECYRQNPTPQTRYALVELCNLHDDSLVFEPIHRAVFDVDSAAFLAALESYCAHAQGDAPPQSFTVVTAAGERQLTIAAPEEALAVGSVQKFLDSYIGSRGGSVDYIHGEAEARMLTKGGAVAILLDVMEKSQLLPAVIRDGVLPRKTFSMGEARDKRYYLECRRLSENHK
ncbi:MAG: DUF1015 domain-containing protein [Angelakisella sp.]